MVNNDSNSHRDVKVLIEPSYVRGFKQIVSFKKSKEELSRDVSRCQIARLVVFWIEILYEFLWY